jgi:hypothetical protein
MRTRDQVPKYYCIEFEATPLANFMTYYSYGYGWQVVFAMQSYLATLKLQCGFYQYPYLPEPGKDSRLVACEEPDYAHAFCY